MNPKYIVIHHSLTEDYDTVSWAAIRDYHVHVNGWADIGYHYGIEKIGDDYLILKGRMDNVAGAHCLGFNDRSIGICVVGDFDRNPPNDIQLNLLRALVRSLMDIYGIKAPEVIGHRESYALRGIPAEKACPGRAFDMDEFRRSL
jgi:N-acetylmuramoyl-L-alanine amidase